MGIGRYQDGKIYKIISDKTNKIYIGSTCKKLLSQRLAAHNTDYKTWKNGKGSYTSSFELFELGSVQITLLEACPCNTKDELLAKERFWIEQHQDIIINKRKPKITSKEKKELKKENRAKIYNCECGTNQITQGNKARHERTNKHKLFINKLDEVTN